MHVLGASPMFQSPVTAPNARAELVIITMRFRTLCPDPAGGLHFCISQFTDIHVGLAPPFGPAGRGRAVGLSGPHLLHRLVSSTGSGSWG